LNPILTIGLLSGIGFGVVYLVARWGATLAPSLVGYGVHWVAAISAFTVLGLWVPDAILYDEIAAAATRPGTEPLPFGKEGWPILLAAVYKVFGHLPAAGLVINVVAAALTVTVLARTASYLGLPPRPTAWLAALMPPGLLWGGLLLRESLTWFFMAGFVLGLAGLAMKRRAWVHLLVVAVSFLGLLQFRGTAAVIVGVAGVVAVFLVRKQYLLLAAGGVAAILIILGPLGAPVRNIIGQYDLERIYVSREWLSDNATTGFPVNNIVDVLAHVMLGPAPWEWGVVGPVFAIDAILWIGIIVLAWRGWSTMQNRRASLVLLLPAFALFASLVITSGNYGTLQRLRYQPELLLLPLAAAGLLAVRDRVRKPKGQEAPLRL
jgi:hypothetical protein